MPKFYSSVRLDIRRIGAVKEGEEVVGMRQELKLLRTKFPLHLSKQNFR